MIVEIKNVLIVTGSSQKDIICVSIMIMIMMMIIIIIVVVAIMTLPCKRQGQ